MKSTPQRAGTVRCQRCLKFGHYTYECQNQVAYRYRPSRTVMFKQQMKLTLNNDKGPQTVIRNPDYKRRVEDRPSSQDQQQIQKKIQNKQEQNKKQAIKMQEKEKQVQNQQKSNEQQDSQSSSSSSSSSDSSSSDSSSDQDSNEQEGPRKKRKL